MDQPVRLKTFKGKVVAIDGPAGSGKSTTARLLARKIGFTYLDTGAMYRAAAWLALEEQVQLSDPDQIGPMLEKLSQNLRFNEDWSEVHYGNRDITTAIRAPEVDLKVSEVASNNIAREFMENWQRRLAQKGSVVLEGRDTGTVVMPSASLKIYLDADVETRASRRLLDYARRGTPTTHEKMIAEIERRDRSDKTRSRGPLRKAPDAIVVNTTDMTIEEQVEAVLRLCRVKLSPA